jgi:DNA invertase Pin-like site-specific DNA recombinase
MKLKTVIFTRVSRKDQSYDRQVSELKEYAIRKGWSIETILSEKISGSKTAVEDRPSIDKLLNLAKSGTIHKVLISEVSRLGRRTKDLLSIIECLHEYKVSLVVYNYQLETLNDEGRVNSMAQFLITLLGDIARMESATLSERINSGLEEAKRKGKKLGRPKGTTVQPEQLLNQYPGIVKDLKSGLSIRKTAAFRQVSIDTVQRVKAVLQQ